MLDLSHPAQTVRSSSMSGVRTWSVLGGNNLRRESSFALTDSREPAPKESRIPSGPRMPACLCLLGISRAYIPADACQKLGIPGSLHTHMNANERTGRHNPGSRSYSRVEGACDSRNRLGRSRSRLNSSSPPSSPADG